MPTGRSMYVRQQGVRVPETQSTEQAPAQTLMACAPCQMFAIQYGDHQGREVKSIAFKVGNLWLMPPNAIEWTKSLKRCSRWLTEQLEQSAGLELVDVPKEDAVDIMPTTSVQSRIIAETKKNAGER